MNSLRSPRIFFSLLKPQMAQTTYTVLYQEAYKFCESTCKNLGIDSSHDASHMARVADLTAELNHRCGRTVTDSEKRVMMLSAFTHDLCDRKYIDVDTGLQTISSWLSTLGLRQEEKEAVVKIITTMSYSKVTKFGYPTDLGEFLLAYHHTRVADLIDAYDIDRCYAYQTHAHPDMDEREKWLAVIRLFESRVLTQKDQYIMPVCPYAADLVELRHTAAVEAVELAKFRIQESKGAVTIQ